MTKQERLFRVVTKREHNGSNIRHTKFWATRKGFEVYIEDCKRKGIKIVSQTEFCEVKRGPCGQ